MRNAFTLIELLVVITIIVVLLSLLAPALDKAIYQAELVVCGSTMKAGTGALTQYAMAHNRTYANRGVSGAHLPDWVRTRGDNAADYNLFRALRDYCGLKTFYDPFTNGVDMSEGVNEPATFILANQNWYNDWARPFWGDGSIRGIMRKMGQR